MKFEDDGQNFLEKDIEITNINNEIEIEKLIQSLNHTITSLYCWHNHSLSILCSLYQSWGFIFSAWIFDSETNGLWGGRLDVHWFWRCRRNFFIKPLYWNKIFTCSHRRSDLYKPMNRDIRNTQNTSYPKCKKKKKSKVGERAQVPTSDLYVTITGGHYLGAWWALVPPS